MIERACDVPNGNYAFIAPYYGQAKSVAWPYLLHYSEPVRAGQAHETELRVRLFNGSQIRLFGADNPDSLRGQGWDGVVLDEYADCRPSLFGAVIRPALADKQGWVTFIGTPRGHTNLYDIWKGKGIWAELDFFRLMLKASETNILPASEIADMKRSMTEDELAQELECSFEAAIKGSVYGKLIAQAEAAGRITSVPYDPALLVHTAWDIGIGDPTAVWFCQLAGRETRLIDYYEASGVDIAHYAGVLKSKGYNYGCHILPHDAEPKQLSSGRSIKEVLESLGVVPIEVQPVSRREDGINAARLRIPMAYFDAKRCDRGIEALKLYRYDYDEILGTFKNNPVHDWTSHAADAFRYLCEGLSRGVGGQNFERKLIYADERTFV